MKLSKCQKGAAMIEYTLLIMFLTIIAIGAVRMVGSGVSETMDYTSQQMGR